MKKGFVSIFCFLLLSVGQLYAQTSPPPLYETEEELPKDLAIEKLPAKKKPTPPSETKPEATPAVKEEITPPKETVTQPEPKIEPEEKIKVEAKEVEIKPVVEPPPQPEITVPADVPVVPVKPIEETAAPPTAVPQTPVTPATEPLVAAPLEDGGPLKDAGDELPNALPVTYAQYESNFLSPTDSLDTFKIYTRAQEGIGVIIKPKHPATQLACDLLGEQGELLSQTQASEPGQPLAFQTSPFEKNGTIYLQVRDNNLPADSPPTEQREYSLELKPIAVIVPPPIPTPPPPPSPPTPQKEVQEESAFQLPENFWQYGLAGGGVLVLVVVLLILIRRRRRKNEHVQNGKGT